MKISHKIALAAGALAVVASAQLQPASAQAWIGQVVGDMMAQQAAAAAQAACMRGQAPPEDERIEALGPSNERLHAYHAAMQAGSAPRSGFYAIDKKTRWTRGETVLDQASIDQGGDPFAAAGLTLDAQPIGFKRSGMDGSALGQWAVRDAAGNAVGVYEVFFIRQLGEWKLRTVTLFDSTSYVGPVQQFCHEPGDVLPYRLRTAKGMQEYHGNRLTKAQAKLGEAQGQLASAEARLAAKPAVASRQAAVDKARAKVAKWQGEVDERQAGLDAALTDEKAALADQAELAEINARARAELGFAGAAPAAGVAAP